MPKRRPYYNLSQIKKGLYTKGGELVYEDGSEYIGQYHELPNGQFFTYDIPTAESKELFKKPPIQSDPAYSRITKVKTGGYSDPVFYIPEIKQVDIDNGFFMRFFVQKKNAPTTTITEISREQYNTVGTTNFGINGVLWRKIELKWAIRSGPSGLDIASYNYTQIQKAEINFPGLSTYLSNLIQFSV